MNEEKRNKMFPSDDPKTWNEGTWPPEFLHQRWRELYLALLTGCGDIDIEAGASPKGVATDAASVADWALRLEVERGCAAV
jgi:hypothetical protein